MSKNHLLHISGLVNMEVIAIASVVVCFCGKLNRIVASLEVFMVGGKLSFFRTQWGGAKMGCIVTFFIAGLILAVGLRIAPVYLSNNDFVDAAEEIAGRASNVTADSITEQILAKARDLKISEALEPGAVRVVRVLTESESTQTGMCTVRIRYVRRVSIYGFFTLKMNTDKEIAKPFLVL